MHTMTQPLPRWLDPKPLSANALKRRPITKFEDGLAEWKRLRGHELNADHTYYGYYPAALSEKLYGAQRDFKLSEKIREAVRNGESADAGYNREFNLVPTRAIEYAAYHLGWRLVPLARWAAAVLQNPELAHDVEAAARDWASQADAVWRLLEAMPESKLARESYRAMVAPVVGAALTLESLVFDELSEYPVLGLHRNPKPQ